MCVDIVTPPVDEILAIVEVATPAEKRASRRFIRSHNRFWAALPSAENSKLRIKGADVGPLGALTYR